VTAICRFLVEKAKVADRMGYENLYSVATHLISNPAIQPSRYEVKIALTDALEDAIETLQEEVAAIRKTL
jgi:hypothetical protein